MKKYLLMPLLALFVAMPAACFAEDVKINANSQTVTGGFSHTITQEERELFGLDNPKIREMLRVSQQQTLNWQGVSVKYKVLESNFKNPVRYIDEMESVRFNNPSDKEPMKYGFKNSYVRTNTLEHSWSKSTAKGNGVSASFSVEGYGYSANYPAGKGLNQSQSQTLQYSSATGFAGLYKPEREFKVSRIVLGTDNVSAQVDITYEITFSGAVDVRHQNGTMEQTEINGILKKADISVTQTIIDTVTINLYGSALLVNAEDLALKAKPVIKLTAKTQEQGEGKLNLLFP